MNKTLHLNLKSQWYDMIFSGIKTEEYRIIGDYWFKRLFLSHSDLEIKCLQYSKDCILAYRDKGLLKSKEFDTITFSNNYAKNRPQIVVEFLGLELRQGNVEWGAEPQTEYFVFKLGKILSNKPITQ